MREILFRGKDIKGFWHTGLLCHIGDAWYISNKAGVATAFEVSHETIRQYTGLTDKNGEKIFEGDIIEVDHGVFGEVEWQKYEARFLLNIGYDWLPMDDCECWKVIGNIHDNPDFMGDMR